MSENPSIKRLQVSKFKLNALLDITMAINENLPQEELLKRYERLLREDLNIGKILIFKFSTDWELILTAGCTEDMYRDIDVERDLIHIREITYNSDYEENYLRHFDITIPVIHKGSPLAYVLIGDIDEEEKGMSPTIKHLHFIQTLSNIIMVAIENIRLFNESLRQEAIRKELELASRMQTMLIPNNETLPRTDKIWVSAFYHPHYDVGGDYYDCLRLSEHEVGFLIADVSGKGISAALLMSNFQANLRALFTADIPLEDLIRILNQRVIENANGEKFITLFVAKYHTGFRKLEFINAAHNPPVFFDGMNKNLTKLETSCLGVGMLDHIPRIDTGEFTVSPGSKIICYTDGLSELRDENDQEMGTRAIEACISNGRSIEENIKGIIESQNILTGNNNIFDDITLIGAQFF
ncbi:MAG TPA: serine/threonine protein phosphatase [Bacteroidetes bacterium]|nr:serine/threonine protein phosphatase [Bacteroidota bacterium]